MADAVQCCRRAPESLYVELAVPVAHVNTTYTNTLICVHSAVMLYSSGNCIGLRGGAEYLDIEANWDWQDRYSSVHKTSRFVVQHLCTQISTSTTFCNRACDAYCAQ
jgi:hypothetical protein